MGNSTANPSTGKSSSRRSAWERWLIVWHVAFYISLITPTILALTTERMRYSSGIVLGLSLLLGAWYALMMIWLVPHTSPNRQTILSLIYLLGAFILWFPLSRASWAYYITASSFYGLMWGTLPFWLAVLGNILLTALIIWSQALNLGKSVVFSFEMLLIGVIVIGWAALLALWMRTIIRESAQRKRLIEQLETAQAELSAAERQAGILQERQRMAGEIHDTLAQSFTSIVMQLEAAEQALPADVNSAASHLQKARESARLGLADARRLVQALRPAPLEDASLPEALKRVAGRWAQENKLQTSFSVTGEAYALHPDLEVSLLRALSEALINTQKHAHAHAVVVTLSYMEDQVALDVQDDGVGFDPDKQNQPGGQAVNGYGLRAMRQRVAQFGGEVIIESVLGEGTTLVVQIPVNEPVLNKGTT